MSSSYVVIALFFSPKRSFRPQHCNLDCVYGNKPDTENDFGYPERLHEQFTGLEEDVLRLDIETRQTAGCFKTHRCRQAILTQIRIVISEHALWNFDARIAHNPSQMSRRSQQRLHPPSTFESSS